MKCYNKDGDVMYNMNKIKELRIAKGISVYEIANYLKVTAAFYSQLENKKKRLYYDTALKLATFFGTKPDELFFLENPKELSK